MHGKSGSPPEKFRRKNFFHLPFRQHLPKTLRNSQRGKRGADRTQNQVLLAPIAASHVGVQLGDDWGDEGDAEFYF